MGPNGKGWACAHFWPYNGLWYDPGEAIFQAGVGEARAFASEYSMAQ